MTPDRVIGQIQVTRRLNTGGFVVFNYDARAAGELVPLLGQGITRKTGVKPLRRPTAPPRRVNEHRQHTQRGPTLRISDPAPLTLGMRL